MDIVYLRGQASVADVHQAMDDRPSYSSVRALMGILEAKRHLRHKAVGGKYVYLPTRSRQAASRLAIRKLVKTFFDGSSQRAMAAMLEAADVRPTNEELSRLADMIDKARKEGR